MGITVHGPERNQKRVLFQNFGGQTRYIIGDVQMAVSPPQCKPPGIFKDKKERKGMLTCIDIQMKQFHLKVTPQQNSQRSCPSTKIWKLKSIGCGKQIKIIMRLNLF